MVIQYQWPVQASRACGTRDNRKVLLILFALGIDVYYREADDNLMYN